MVAYTALLLFVGFGIVTTALYAIGRGTRAGLTILPCVVCCESRKASSLAFPNRAQNPILSRFYSVGVAVVLLTAFLGFLFIAFSAVEKCQAAGLCPDWGIPALSENVTEPLLAIARGISLPRVWNLLLAAAALFLALVVHEIGHGIAAVNDGLQPSSVGIVLAGPFPGAFVRLPEGARRVDWRSKLRIFTAGVWHNLVAAGIVLLLCQAVLLPFYHQFAQPIEGAASPMPPSVVVSVDENSPLYGILKPGAELSSVGFSSVDTAGGWHSALRELQEDELRYNEYAERLAHVEPPSPAADRARPQRLRGAAAARPPTPAVDEPVELSSGPGMQTVPSMAPLWSCCATPNTEDRWFSGHCDWPCPRTIDLPTPASRRTHEAHFVPQGKGWCVPKALVANMHPASFQSQSTVQQNPSWLDMMLPPEPGPTDSLFYFWSPARAVWHSFALTPYKISEAQQQTCAHPAAASSSSPSSTSLDLNTWADTVCEDAAEESICVLPGALQGTSLLPLTLANGTSIMFEGPAAALEQDITVSDWRPRSWVLGIFSGISYGLGLSAIDETPTMETTLSRLSLFEFTLWIPLFWLKFAQYFIAVSLLMGVFNALPCVLSDGDHIARAVCIEGAKRMFAAMPAPLCRSVSHGMFMLRAAGRACSRVMRVCKCSWRTEKRRRGLHNRHGRLNRTIQPLRRLVGAILQQWRPQPPSPPTLSSGSLPPRSRTLSDSSDSSFSSGEFDLPALDLEDPLVLPQHSTPLEASFTEHSSEVEGKSEEVLDAEGNAVPSPTGPGSRSALSSPIARQRAGAVPTKSLSPSSSPSSSGGLCSSNPPLPKDAYGLAWAEYAGNRVSDAIVIGTTALVAIDSLLALAAF